MCTMELSMPQFYAGTMSWCGDKKIAISPQGYCQIPYTSLEMYTGFDTLASSCEKNLTLAYVTISLFLLCCVVGWGNIIDRYIVILCKELRNTPPPPPPAAYLHTLRSLPGTFKPISLHGNCERDSCYC